MSIKKAVIRNGILHKANVVGYSLELKPRIRNGKIIEDELCIRIYVKKKLPITALRKADIIPEELELKNGSDRFIVRTDVVGIEDPLALSSKTSRIRPVPLGVSIGHWDITAGSLGLLFEKNGVILAGSNAHVLTPDPSLQSSEIHEKRIVQPGVYHGGKKNSNVVGKYLYHKRIVPSTGTCSIARGICKFLNYFSKLLGRKGMFSYVTYAPNYIDFAVYEPTVDHILEVADGSFTNKDPFIGLLFAGSSSSGVICKSKYIEELGFKPLIPSIEVKDNDIVGGCSFWCHYVTKVMDSSAALSVNYGSYRAFFEDVILVYNDNTIRGGWSGSGWRLVKKA